MSRIFTLLTSLQLLVLLASNASSANDSDWQAMVGSETLHDFIAGLKAERKLPNGTISRGEYFADGTGVLYSWGATIPRTWSIKGEDQLCITAGLETNCYLIDRHINKFDLYRVRDVITGRIAVFKVVEQSSAIEEESIPVKNEGSASTASASEIAAELSNPNTAVATLNFRNQFSWFEGDLPDADRQSSFTLLFQPVLPFVLKNGAKIIWRPAIPFLLDQPRFDVSNNDFDDETALGDIVMDIAYAPKIEGGLLLAYGLITSLPTATNNLGSDRYTLGPELLLGRITPNSVYGVFPNHQWDVGGSGDADISLTTVQAFYTYLPGGGWNVGSAPTATYDWEDDQWTVPVQFNLGKTIVMNGRPWRLSAEFNYYVEKDESFGPEWLVSLNIAPVVKNGLASLFGL